MGKAARVDGNAADAIALSATSYAVLGMLSFGEMSGYDMLKLAERSIRFFWTPVKSQVYSELRRLAAAGLATEREIEQSERPDKRLYLITPGGQEVLRRWLEEAPLEPETYKSVFLLKLFFGRHMSRDALVAMVEEHREEASRALASLRELKDEIEDGDPSKVDGGDPSKVDPSYLVLRYGLSHFDASVHWCDRTLRVLRKGEGR